MKALFVPGLCCRSEIWEEASARLPGVDVVALDWPFPEVLQTYDRAAEWLDAAIHEHCADAVVAHSLGGAVALHLRGPEPSWRLVVVDTFLFTPAPIFRNHVWQPAPELRARVARMLAEETPRFPLLRALASGGDPPRWRERALATRAVYIYGGRSDEHDAAALGELAGVTAGHDVRVIPGASHFLMLERPAEFYATLGAILSID